MERIIQHIDKHPHPTGLLAFVLWIALVYLGLTAFEFSAIIYAVGIFSVVRWIINVGGAPAYPIWRQESGLMSIFGMVAIPGLAIALGVGIAFLANAVH